MTVWSKCLPAKGPDRHSAVATKGQIPSFTEGIHCSLLIQNDDKVGRLKANQSNVKKKKKEGREKFIKGKQERRNTSKGNLEIVK